MEPLDIQYELKKKKITQKSIAQELGCSEMSVSNVIAKRLQSDRIMKAVARAIDKDHKQVFPEHYFRTYLRKRPVKTAAI
ncbi:MAG: helix-turn-helix transcriptional regulator [Candidatus Omnitrophota bacterium]|jgi:lambda repressor-like predicted transcriptional regulator